MKQVFLKGNGEIEVLEAPIPLRIPGTILVQNAFSLISTGTESAAVSNKSGIMGAYEKIWKSKDKAGQVWSLAQKQGLISTLGMVKEKINDYSMLGYSCAGKIIETDSHMNQFKIGQNVACMGVGYANHAEYVVIPKNLAVILPESVPLDQAAFGSIACVALQGIRRLELTPGERIGVIGLGLVGQLCIRLLSALGYDVYGIDIDDNRVLKANEVVGVQAWSSAKTDSVSYVSELTEGRGLDGVIVCAATKSDEPVNLAFDLCRQRGRVSIVGDVGLGLKREKMYKKEIELRLSSSYGPGRYDENYEVRGQDYPFAYVRWTEKRNLELVIELIKKGKLNFETLISKKYMVENADEAYALLKKGDSNTYGVMLDYDIKSTIIQQNSIIEEGRSIRTQAHLEESKKSDIIRLGLIGVGGYAKGVHIPNIKKLGDRFEIYGVASKSGGTAAAVSKRTGAKIATSDYGALLDDNNVNAVIISTRHASHAEIVLKAIDAGKNVYVEKPMTTNIEDAELIIERARDANVIIRVGFNRRFSPYINAMKKAIGTSGFRTLLCRVNIGTINNDWSNTKEEGGRFLGEGVHFLDLCNWFMEQEPKSLTATFTGISEITNPNMNVLISYPDGSTAQIVYTSNGNISMGKEYYEAFGNGCSVIINDFKKIKIFGKKMNFRSFKKGDKGQLEALKEFSDSIYGIENTIKGADEHAGLIATEMALAAYESAKKDKTIYFKDCY